MGDLPVKANDIARSTNKEPVLSWVRGLTVNGWPSSVREETFSPFFVQRHELSVNRGRLLLRLLPFPTTRGQGAPTGYSQYATFLFKLSPPNFSAQCGSAWVKTSRASGCCSSCTTTWTPLPASVASSTEKTKPLKNKETVSFVELVVLIILRKSVLNSKLLVLLAVFGMKKKTQWDNTVIIAS